ncbi:MAG: DUF2812 domain-containing protein [Proteobacteria bacterium]|nr:DUF2812 domain-containing protein [Pseudomonadota bacterium]MBU4297453.1 DUF2812 domain-containing protein [Pseudomonadota bacterium]MCG2746436.1 DUF2812 domain-containing protein [Desulfobulbaceae bacterium]
MPQYKILKADSLINEKQLNELAQEGWRLVTIVKDSDLFYFYFEKVRPTNVTAVK